MKIPHLPHATRVAAPSLATTTAQQFKTATDEFNANPNNKNTISDDAAHIPYYDPFKGRYIDTSHATPYLGMDHFAVFGSLDMSKPDQGVVYQYGELTEHDDINAFLDQVERLEGEHRTMFEHLKPTQDLLNLAQRMSDEELAQFAEFMVTTSSIRFGLNNRDISEQLIASLSKHADDVLSSSISTMAALLKQGDDYKKPTSPTGEDEHGNELLILQSTQEHVDWFASHYKAKSAKSELANNYASLLMNKTLSDNQLIELNTHLSTTNLEQSNGIIDMMSLIKTHQNDDVLAMLNEVDKNNDTDVFTYLAQQRNYQAHKQYYQLDNGRYVAQQDNISTPSDRRHLYDNILTAYNTAGLGWINDALDELKDSPAQIQNTVWDTLLADKETMPEQFTSTDSLQIWVANNLKDLEMQFHTQQISKIHDYNEAGLVPDELGRLTFVASGNTAQKTHYHQPATAPSSASLLTT
ncbi:hypothetical protein [Pseudoalteromonas mariniglutinosa]|uniref:hypothetical protein n=1 Tax=Pseudoalteromonas mariniglutinosa TaxID=206042 RepID=UPI00384BAC44